MTLKLLIVLIIFFIWGDSLSTYLCLTQVPGGEEANPLVIPLINLLGIGPAMLLSGIGRTVGALWLYRLADTGDLRYGLIYVGMNFVFLMTLAANVNNWTLWINGAM